MSIVFHLVCSVLFSVVALPVVLALRDEQAHLRKLSQKALLRTLSPMFEALPKNEYGRLTPDAARYAVHRTLLRLHSWYIFGLAPEPGNVTSTPSPSEDFQGLPPDLERIFRKHLDVEGGLGLQDTLMMAYDLEQIVHMVAVRQLEWAWQAYGLPPAPKGTLKINGVYDVLDLVMMAFILKDKKEDSYYRSNFVETDPEWAPTQTFVRSLARSVLTAEKSAFTFTDVKRVVFEITERHGPWQTGQCMQLKERLVAKERHCPGRVDLGSFYSETIEKGSKSFIENPDYLKVLGALDMSDPGRPSLLIPNYISSAANRVFHTEFHAVVCPEECEDLLGKLEVAFAAPEVTPEEIASFVSSLPSSSQPDGPGILPPWLLQRLNDVAALHNGRVPLHGRRFYQWLHSVYPRECPFPQVAGSTEQLMPRAFELRHGKSRFVASDVMHKLYVAYKTSLQSPVLDDAALDDGRCFAVLPEEELVAVHMGPRYGSWVSFAWLAAALAILTANVLVIKLLIHRKARSDTTSAHVAGGSAPLNAAQSVAAEGNNNNNQDR
eukprot:TRINITY_DN32295_c0_g1_i1.p1 TRINITY_DN32295_c0_g1~~TRINITY_DN32295_c0_g1_i1.p1  ORF type:complete len:568 (+),score=89.26 TRINITY_DN32295_c0_g1_i1:55-1704(+)